MKTEEEIRTEIVRLNHLRSEKTKELGKLHQIDLLSGEGNRMKADCDYLLGQIAALTWVIND